MVRNNLRPFNMCFEHNSRIDYCVRICCELYIMKGKRIPKDFDITDFDPNGVVVVSECGYMNSDIWDNVTNMISHTIFMLTMMVC